jgi:phosphoserine phosphatase
MKIVLFDFCETMIKFQTHDKFIGYYFWEKRNIRKYFIYKIFKSFFSKVFCRVFGINLKHKLVHLLKDEKKRDIERISKNFAQVIVFSENKDVIEELILHSQNFKIVVISAGFADNIRDYLALKGIQDIDVIANELLFSQGVCAGSYVQLDCFGAEKKKRLSEAYTNADYIACYTDSISDKPILDLCDHKIIVEKNKNIVLYSDSQFSESKKAKIKQKLWRSVSAILLDKIYLSYCYKRIHGRAINWKYPTALTEFIQIDKIYQKRKKNMDLADKLRSRDVVTKKLKRRYLPELYDVFKSVEEIDLAKYVDKNVVLKTNHDSSGAVILRAGDFYCAKAIKNSLDIRLHREHWRMTREYQYRGIVKCILVEEMLTHDGRIPNDLKIHCFNGVPHYIYVSIDREGINKRQIYDSRWNLVKATWQPAGSSYFELSKPLVDKPQNLSELLDVAVKLSEGLRYCRIDLYNTDRGIVFGEITLHPHGGLEPILPGAFDLKLGSLLGVS